MSKRKFLDRPNRSRDDVQSSVASTEANESTNDDELYASYLKKLNLKEDKQSDKDAEHENEEADGNNHKDEENDGGNSQAEDQEESVSDYQMEEDSDSSDKSEETSVGNSQVRGKIEDVGVYQSQGDSGSNGEHEENDGGNSQAEDQEESVSDYQMEEDSGSSDEAEAGDDSSDDHVETDEEHDYNYLKDIEALDDSLDQIETTSTASVSNHLPPGFYTTVESNIHTAAFVGMFGADGINSAAYYLTAMGLRSTAFPFLYRLLRLAGVSEPSLSYKIKKSPLGKRFKAGFHMDVHWGFKNKKLVEERRGLGLPSSRIHNTDIDLARKFLFSLSLKSLPIVILYWIAGDGTVYYRYHTKSQITTIKYSYLCIYSRDRKILELFGEALSYHGFEKTCVSSYQNSGVSKMFLWNDIKLNNTILDCLNCFNEEDLHPKLKLLREFLTSDTQCISLRFQGVKTMSYFDYLGDSIKDPICCLLGQDFYSLNLFEVNEILAFGNIDPIADTRLFNIADFLQKAIVLVDKRDKSPQEAVFCNYITHCRDRVYSNQQIEDYKPIIQPLYFCDLCSVKPMKYKQSMDDHMKKKHPNGEKIDSSLHRCQFVDCKRVFGSANALDKHVRKDHFLEDLDEVLFTTTRGKQKYACAATGCNVKCKRLDHIKRHCAMHEDEKFECTFGDCDRVFKRQDYMQEHLKSHVSRVKFKCPYINCSKEYTRKSMLEEHIAHKHEMIEQEFKCKYPNCGKSYTTRRSLHKHKDKTGH